MSEPSLRYAVVLERPGEPEVPAVSAALAAWRGVPPADTTLEARRAWGIVARGESEPRAKALIEALASARIAALAVPESLLEEPPAPEPIPALERSLVSRLVLLAAAGFRETTVKTVTEGPSMAERAVKLGLTMAGLPLPVSQGRKKRVEEADLVFYADLVLESPAERLRVDVRSFNFSCLGARKVYGALVNFRTLLEWLSDAAPKAIRNRGCRYLLEGKAVREMGYESLPDLDSEIRWLLTLKALGKAA